MSESVELVFQDGAKEIVVGPFEAGLCVNDCSIFEPGLDPDHSCLVVAEWTYSDGPAGENEGWEIQQHVERDDGRLWPIALVRSAATDQSMRQETEGLEQIEAEADGF